MTKIVPVAAALLLALLCAPSAAEPQTPTRARANLASYVSDADYPDEAIRNNEEGTVRFRLDVGRDGKPTACTIVSSSGSALLDSTTCHIMMTRPRFEPALDERGRPVPDQATSQITWRLPKDPPPRTEAVVTLWATCLAGETAKLTTSDLPVDEIVRRSFGPCTALEALVLRELGEDFARALKNQLTATNRDSLERFREALEHPAAGPTREEHEEGTDAEAEDLTATAMQGEPRPV